MTDALKDLIKEPTPSVEELKKKILHHREKLAEMKRELERKGKKK